MILFSSVDPVFIILPIVLVQYVYATFALVRLARARLSAGKYALWNVFIVGVFFIGSTAFLIYDHCRNKKVDKEQVRLSDTNDRNGSDDVNGEVDGLFESTDSDTERQK